MGDLKGKVFAAEPNTPARLIAQIMLKKEGLTFADLQAQGHRLGRRHRGVRRSGRRRRRGL